MKTIAQDLTRILRNILPTCGKICRMATLTRQVPALSGSEISRPISSRTITCLHFIVKNVDPLQRVPNALHRCDERDHKAVKENQSNASQKDRLSFRPVPQRRQAYEVSLPKVVRASQRFRGNFETRLI